MYNQQFVYCYHEENPDSLVMLQRPQNIRQLILYSPQEPMFIWIANPKHKQWKSMKQKIRAQAKVFMVEKETIKLAKKQFEQQRTKSNVVIICSIEHYQQASRLQLQQKTITKIICFRSSEPLNFIQNSDILIIDSYQHLLEKIKQLKGQKIVKVLPNFLFLTSDTIKQVGKSKNILKIIHAMLRQEIDYKTKNLIIDNLQKLICVLEEDNVLSQKSRNFIDDLRSGVDQKAAIKWYTEISIVNRLINNLLRSARHPMEFFYVQPYFKILFNSILKIYRQTHFDSEKPFKCFRGGKITEQQLQRFARNKGSLVQNLGFLSTSLDLQVADSFCENVVFEIQVFPHRKDEKYDSGYAKISKLSEFYGEEEVLFNPLNYFIIVSVERQDSLDKWTIKLENWRRHNPTIDRPSCLENIVTKGNQIVGYLQLQNSITKLQGNCFCPSYDLYGHEKYWRKYLQLVSQKPKDLQNSLFQIKNIQALLNLANYHIFIGSLKQTQQILNEAFQIVFQSGIQGYFMDIHRIQHKIKTMTNEKYYLCTKMIDLLCFFQVREGKYKKVLETIKIYLSIDKKFGKDGNIQILGNYLLIIYMKMKCYSKAHLIFEDYMNAKMPKQPYSLVKGYGKMPKQMEFTDGFDLSTIIKSYQNLLCEQFQIIGFDDYQYILLLQSFRIQLAQNYSYYGQQTNHIIKKCVQVSKQIIQSSCSFVYQYYALIFLSDHCKGDETLRKIQDYLKTQIASRGIVNIFIFAMIRRLASLYFEAGSVSHAISLLEITTRIFQDQINAIQDTEYWIHLRQLAMLYSKIGKYQKAYETLYKAVISQQTALETQNSFYAVILYELGCILKTLKFYTWALSTFEEAQQLYQMLFGDETKITEPNYFILLNITGKAYLQNNQIDKAQIIYEKSLNLSKKVFHQNHAVYLEAYYGAGLICKHRGDLNNAIRIFNEIIAVKQELKVYDIDCFNVWGDLSLSYRLVGKKHTGIKILRKCIKVQIKQKYFQDSCFFEALQNLENSLIQAGKYSQAIKSILQCLRLKVNVFKKIYYPIIKSLCRLLTLSEAAGNIYLSFKTFQELLKIYKKAEELAKNQREELLKHLNKFGYSHLLSIDKYLPKAVKAFTAVAKRLKQTKLSDLMRENLLNYLNKILLVYQELGSVSKSIETVSQIMQLHLGRGLQTLQECKTRDKFRNGLVKNGPLTIAAAKIRGNLSKLTGKLRNEIYGPTALFKFPNFYFECLKERLSYTSTLILVVEKLRERLIKKKVVLRSKYLGTLVRKKKRKEKESLRKSLYKIKRTFRKNEMLYISNI